MISYPSYIFLLAERVKDFVSCFILYVKLFIVWKLFWVFTEVFQDNSSAMEVEEMEVEEADRLGSVKTQMKKHGKVLFAFILLPLGTVSFLFTSVSLGSFLLLSFLDCHKGKTGD